ncbi:MAG: tectonin domain-containing protein, partial [Candidatus Nitrosocosmicus sp.]
MKLKSYLVLFIIALSAILLLNSGAVAQVKAKSIYKWDGNNFVQVPGNLEHIAVGADGSVWGVNSNAHSDNIYKWDGNNFVQVPGNLESISVGNKDNVWGLNSDDMIYKWDGNNF